MLKLIGGELYQWDKCRKIAIDDPEGKITEIHYARDCDNSCIVVTVKTDESGAKYAEIPNILLQSFCPVFAYAVNVQNGESITVTASTFIVRQKGKPADYVYTETETLCYKELDKRIKKLEEGGGAAEQKTEVIYVNITENEDGEFSADKTTAELKEAYNSGCAIFAKVNYESDSVVFGLTACYEGEDYLDFLFSGLENNEQVSFVVIFREDETTDIVEYDSLPLSGGNANEKLTIKVGGIPYEYDGTEEKVVNIVSVKNPFPLVIKGVSYTGATKIDFTDTINQMIDEKLGVIENAAY